jgi:catechol 2,3-dioxygenase-like lactoylglutathione lyase family enzyme
MSDASIAAAVVSPQLHLIGLVVADMARALAFYRALGLEFAAGAELEDHVEYQLPSGLWLAWDTQALIQRLYPDLAPSVGPGRVALAFLCASAAAVDASYQAMVAQGYHGQQAPWDAFWGQRYAVVHDPDGNPVDLFAPLP